VYRAYWLRYWESRTDEERELKRAADKEAKTSARRNRSDVQRELDSFRRYMARKKKMDMETSVSLAN
jgi:hypothetical protein